MLRQNNSESSQHTGLPDECGSFTCPAVKQVLQLRSEIAELKKLLIATTHTSVANDVLTNEQLMATYKISRTTAAEWRNSGKISFYKVGRLIMYQRSDIETFLQNHKHKAF